MNIPNKILEKMNNYVNKKDLDVLKRLADSLKDDKIIVTCLGLYNNGKSSLLNALIDDVNNNTFKVADIRETTSNKKYPLSENIIIVDTPGLNHSHKDDEILLKATITSHINLIVHNVNNGELNKAEIDFFHKIKDYWKHPKEFIKNSIFVLSRIDEAHDFSIIENNEKRIKEQIKEIFGIEPIVIAVSAKDYIDGLKENEEELIKDSNIKELKSLIIEKSKRMEAEIIKTSRYRFNKQIDKLISLLNDKYSIIEKEVENKKKEYIKLSKEFEKDLEEATNRLNSLYNQL